MSGQRKGFTNIKYNLDLVINTTRLKNTACEILHDTHTHTHTHAHAHSYFQYFTSLTQRTHGVLHRPSFTTGAIVQVSLHAFIWHLLCISNAAHSLQLQRRSAFVFCNTNLWCLPNNKFALAATSNGRAKELKSKNLNVSYKSTWG